MSSYDQRVQVGDVGTVFELTVKDQDEVVVDLSTTSEKALRFLKPDKIGVEKTASFVTDGSDGKIAYTAETGFLDSHGVWQVQARVKWASGNEFYSNRVDVLVSEKIATT